jgi:hypothetical protein
MILKIKLSFLGLSNQQYILNDQAKIMNMKIISYSPLIYISKSHLSLSARYVIGSIHKSQNSIFM